MKFVKSLGSLFKFPFGVYRGSNPQNILSIFTREKHERSRKILDEEDDDRCVFSDNYVPISFFLFSFWFVLRNKKEEKIIVACEDDDGGVHVLRYNYYYYIFLGLIIPMACDVNSTNSRGFIGISKIQSF